MTRHLYKIFWLSWVTLGFLHCGTTEPTPNGNKNNQTAPPALSQPTTNPPPIHGSCNVLAKQVCVLPFPSSVFAKIDTSTPSGHRLELSQEADFAGVWSKVSALTHDGYSTLGAITTTLKGGILPESLPQTYEESLAPDASVLIVNADATSPNFGKRVPFAARVFVSSNKKVELLSLTPLRAMSYQSRYAVIVTSKVLQRDKTPHQPSSEMQTLLADFQPEGQLTPWWTYYRGLRWLATQKLNIPKANIVQMWDFHTRSQKNATQDILDLVEQTKAWLKTNPPKPTVVKTFEEKDNLRTTFSFQLPLWVAEGGSYFQRDKEGKAKVAKVIQLQGELVIAKSVTKDNPSELVMFGHGLGSQLSASLGFMHRLVKLRPIFAVAGMDWDIHGQRGKGIPDFLAIAGKLDVLRIAAMFQQNLCDSIVFAKVLEALIQLPEFQGRLRPLRFYIGQSMGGFVGAMVAALHPSLKVFALNVTGAGMSHVMRLGAIGNEFGLKLLMQDPMQEKPAQGLPWDASLEVAMEMSQIGLDLGDPISLAPFVQQNRINKEQPEIPAILLQQSLGDSIVPNFSTHILARTIELPLIEPILSKVFGLQTAASPTEGTPQSGLTQFRTSEVGTSAHLALSNNALRLQILDYFESFVDNKGKPGNITYQCNGNNSTCDFVKE